jgi:hypothetical protein
MRAGIVVQLAVGEHQLHVHRHFADPSILTHLKLRPKVRKCEIIKVCIRFQYLVMSSAHIYLS